MITFDQVSFGYTHTQTVENVSFTLPAGGFTALIGANGAGKSTVSKLMRGLLKPTSGRVLFKDQDLKSMKASTLAANMGFLFQNPDRQICKKTVLEELMFTLACTGADESTKEQQCLEVMKALHLAPDDDPMLLSRGERQRVALASALVHKPELLILDEPTTGLDYLECTRIMEYVKTLSESGTTVCMVCHDMEVVLDYAKDVIIMRDGKVLGSGSVQAMFRDQALLREAGLLPPQIIGLGAALGGEFTKASTVDEMTRLIAQRKGVVA